LKRMRGAETWVDALVEDVTLAASTSLLTMGYSIADLCRGGSPSWSMRYYNWSPISSDEATERQVPWVSMAARVLPSVWHALSPHESGRHVSATPSSSVRWLKRGNSAGVMTYPVRLACEAGRVDTKPLSRRQPKAACKPKWIALMIDGYPRRLSFCPGSPVGKNPAGLKVEAGEPTGIRCLGDLGGFVERAAITVAAAARRNNSGIQRSAGDCYSG